MQQSSIPLPAQVMDPSHALQRAVLALGTAYTSTDRPRSMALSDNSFKTQQCYGHGMQRNENDEAWKAAAASGPREHRPVMHAENTNLKPRPKTTLFIFPTGSELLQGKKKKKKKKKSEKYKHLGLLKQRSNVYVYYVKNTHGVRSLSRTHSAIIISAS